MASCPKILNDELVKTKEDLVDIKQKINQAASNNATFQVWDKMLMTEFGKQRCLRRVGHVCADQGRDRQGRVWREIIVSVELCTLFEIAVLFTSVDALEGDFGATRDLELLQRCDACLHAAKVTLSLILKSGLPCQGPGPGLHQ
jgi:hypothetical protein